MMLTDMLELWWFEIGEMLSTLKELQWCMKMCDPLLAGGGIGAYWCWICMIHCRLEKMMHTPQMMMDGSIADGHQYQANDDVNQR